ncbi:MAG: V-type ATP synthase subunit E [Candidatus Methanomethylicaceae archaeon]
MSQAPSVEPQVEAFKKMIDKIFDDVKARALSIFNEAAEKVVTILNESEKFSIARCQEILSTYEEKAEIESRKEISRSEVEARMSLLNLKESYIDRVFKDACSKLMEYCETEDYLSDLLGNLQRLSGLIPVGEVLMSERDIKRLGAENLKKALGMDLQVRAHPVKIGGFVAVSKDKKISLDRTLESIIDGERQILRSRIASILFG